VNLEVLGPKIEVNMEFSQTLKSNPEALNFIVSKVEMILTKPEEVLLKEGDSLTGKLVSGLTL